MSSTETYYPHASRQARLDSGDGVLKDDAVRRRDPKKICNPKIDLGMWFWIRDLGAVDDNLTVGPQAGAIEDQPYVFGLGVTGHGHRRTTKGIKEIPDAGNEHLIEARSGDLPIRGLF